MTAGLKKVLMIGAVALGLALGSADESQALPTLTFSRLGNGIVYKGPDVDPGLEIAAAIDDILDIDPSLIKDEWFNNDLRLFITASFQSVETSADGVVTATFTGSGSIGLGFLAGFGELGPDELILEGDFVSLNITGASGDSSATVSARLQLSDGLLVDEFGTEAVLQAEIFNLKFSEKFFKEGFSQGLQGTISALPATSPAPVPEPTTLFLLGLGIVGLAVIGKIAKTRSVGYEG